MLVLLLSRITLPYLCPATHTMLLGGQYMASRGHRVIGCAQYLLPGDKYPLNYQFSKNDLNYPSEDYCFVGLVSLEDPPKHGVREAIGTLRLAGIKVMMVTGTYSSLIDFPASSWSLKLTWYYGARRPP